MKSSYRSRTLASLAIVGTIAAVSIALLKTGPSGNSAMNLAATGNSSVPDDVQQAFTKYISKQGKSYLT